MKVHRLDTVAVVEVTPDKESKLHYMQVGDRIEVAILGWTAICAKAGETEAACGWVLYIVTEE